MTDADHKRLEEIRAHVNADPRKVAAWWEAAQRERGEATLPFLLSLVDNLTKLLHDRNEETGYSYGCVEGQRAERERCLALVNGIEEAERAAGFTDGLALLGEIRAKIQGGYLVPTSADLGYLCPSLDAVLKRIRMSREPLSPSQTD